MITFECEVVYFHSHFHLGLSQIDHNHNGVVYQKMYVGYFLWHTKGRGIENKSFLKTVNLC